MCVLEKCGGTAFGAVYSKMMSGAGKVYWYAEVQDFPLQPKWVHFPKVRVDGGWRCDVGDANGYVRDVTLEEIKELAVKHRAIGLHLLRSVTVFKAIYAERFTERMGEERLPTPPSV
jgi:hypothetical protein